MKQDPGPEVVSAGQPEWELVQRIAKSPGFARSPRLTALLTHIVEHKMNGSAGGLSEALIAISVFGRPADYNPAEDSIVRTHVRLLRQKLEAYFAGEGATESLILEVPKGAYVPVFTLRPAPAATPPEPVSEVRPKRSPGLRRGLIAAALVAAACAGYLFAVFTQRPPSISYDPAPLTFYPGREGAPALSPDGKMVAFMWNGPSFGTPQVYVKHLDASLPLQITHGPGQSVDPAWSPDGLQIAFTHDAGGGETSVVLVPALGGPEREVTRFKGSSWNGTAWLTGGNRLVISVCSEGGAPCYLLAVPLDRGTPKVLTQPPGRLTDVFPAVSPDGKTLAFARVGDANNTVNQLFVLQLDANQNPAGPPRKLKPELLAIGGIAWAPDGKSLFVSSLRNGESRMSRVFLPGGEIEPFPSGAAGVSRISIAPAARTMAFVAEQHDIDVYRLPGPGWQRSDGPAGEAQRVIASSFDDAAPNVSRDGRRITFASLATGAMEIWVSDADGNDAVPITNFGGPPVGTPRWSPDGTRITFDSRKYGHSDIFVVSSNGGLVTRLTDEPSTEHQPEFSTDGRYIYFASDRTGRFEIWKAPSGGGKAIQVTTEGGLNARTLAGTTWVYYLKGTTVRRLREPNGTPETVADGAEKGNWAPYHGGIARYSGKSMDVWPEGADHWTTLRTMPREIMPRFPIVPALSFTEDDREAYVALTTLDRADLMVIRDIR